MTIDLKSDPNQAVNLRSPQTYLDHMVRSFLLRALAVSPAVHEQESLVALLEYVDADDVAFVASVCRRFIDENVADLTLAADYDAYQGDSSHGSYIGEMLHDEFANGDGFEGFVETYPTTDFGQRLAASAKTWGVGAPTVSIMRTTIVRVGF